MTTGRRSPPATHLWFEAIAVGALVLAGLVFAITGFEGSDGSGRFWTLLLLTVGGATAAAVVPLSGSGRHATAGLAALVAVVTPTGFAYPLNLFMVVVAVVEFRKAQRYRSGDQTAADAA